MKTMNNKKGIAALPCNDKGLATRLLACCLLVTALFACEDMLETGTSHYKDTDGYVLDSPNDTLYSMVGILRKVQAIADRYVLTGELRGDLMDITENATMDLQAIYRFDFGMTDNNPYIDTRPYYDIINNCNFFIRRTDTLAMAAGVPVMAKELAAVKTIRAWVYMLLLLNSGKACYYEDPILTVEDRNKIKNDSASFWISDLATLLDREKGALQQAWEVQQSLGNPVYQGLTLTDYAFIPAELVLADLYLYTGNAASAAYHYHDFLYSRKYNTLGRRSRWMDAGFMSYNSSLSFDMEFISMIYTTTENETGSSLMGWCYPTEWSTRIPVNCTYQLKPSEASIDIWNRQEYAFLPADATPQDEPVYRFSDMRGTRRFGDGTYSNIHSVTTPPPFSATYLHESYQHFVTAASDTLPFIVKYGGMEGSYYMNVSYIYRTGLVFLRYAEALNRLQKPTLAFALLKYGVSNAVFTDPEKVNPEEVNPLPGYCNFPEVSYPLNQTRGMHSRGSGESDRNKFYVIPAGCDTTRFVDEKICEELAIETAFEGNRFHDLMRFAKYYGPDFLATRVATRRGTLDENLKAKLMIEQKWYLPHN
jgi:hypothetical protein